MFAIFSLGSISVFSSEQHNYDNRDRESFAINVFQIGSLVHA